MSVYLLGFPYTTITWTWTHGYCNLSDLDTVFSECCDKLRKLMVPHTVMNMYLGLQVTLPLPHMVRSKCRELIEHSRHWLRCLQGTLSELHGTHPFKFSLPGLTSGGRGGAEQQQQLKRISQRLWPPFMVRFHITDSIPIVVHPPPHVILLHWMAGRPCIAFCPSAGKGQKSLLGGGGV